MTTNDYAQRAREAVAALAADPRVEALDMVVEQRIVDGHVMHAQYHLRFGSGGPTVVEGPAADPDIVITSDPATADALGRGDVHAHRAFLTGRLRLDGDIALILQHADLLSEMTRGRGGTDA